MSFYLTILQIGFFLFIFFQDLKERKVYIVVFLLSFLNALFLFFEDPIFFKEELFLNYLSIGMLLSSVWCYCKLKKISFSDNFGLGDVYFFVIMATCFKTINFIPNFVFSLIFSLTLHLILKRLPSYKTTVPLAGFQALYCSFIYIITLF